jgi:hypothetical protein
MLLMPGCRQPEQKVDVPDVQDVLHTISYLDSLIGGAEIDSIGQINEQLTAQLAAYENMAQTADDEAILDSLKRISLAASDLMQFCNSTITNLDMLEQDTRALEKQYRSGKIKIAAYISALLETEQMLVEIDNQLNDKHHKALQHLKQRPVLISMLSPLPGSLY